VSTPVKAKTSRVDKLSDDILRGIGDIITRWGYLQFQLGVIIRVALRLKKATGRVLTIGMEVGVLCGVLRTISKTDRWIKDKTIRAQIKTLANDVQNAVENRNNYAHGVFGAYTDESPQRFARLLVRQAEHRVNPEWEVITPDSLKEIALEARGLWARAQELTDKLKKKP
jgi:hypothetical protein